MFVEIRRCQLPSQMQKTTLRDLKRAYVTISLPDFSSYITCLFKRNYLYFQTTHHLTCF